MWENIKELVGGISPTLGTLVGGPVGGAVGSLIARALGVADNPVSIENALKTNPDAYIKLKELENSKEIAILQVELETKKVGINAVLDDKRITNERTGLFLSDVQDARDMQKENLKQDDKFSKRFVYILASVWSVFSMIYIMLITFSAIPTANVRFADTILGFLLGTIVATIINFFLGSSDKQVEQQLPPELVKAIEDLKKKYQQQHV